MANLIEKIEAKLIELGVVQPTKLAEEEVVESGTTEVVATEAAPAVVVAQIVPNPIDISYSAIGAPAFAKDAEGVETAVEDGEYLIRKDDVDKKIVIKDGKLESETVVEEVEDVVELSEEEKAKAEADAKTDAKTDIPKTEETKLEAEVKDEATEKELEMAAKLRSVLSNIDVSKAGYYYISMNVNEDGDVEYATMSSETYETLMSKQENEIGEKVTELTNGFETKLADEKAKYESIIEALKTGDTKLSQKPEVEVPVKLSRKEVLKNRIKNK